MPHDLAFWIASGRSGPSSQAGVFWAFFFENCGSEGHTLYISS